MRLSFLLILIPGLAANCTKEEATPRSYPRVDTGSITEITEQGAVFNGEITFTSVPIIDHGFVWSNEPNFTPNQGDQLSLGARSGTGLFSAPCNYALMKSRKYYVRAFAKSEQNMVYGDIMTFESRGSALPVVLDITPKDGTWDDLITLTGNNLSAIESNLVVRFGSAEAYVVESGENFAIVKVPYQLDAKESTVSLTWNGITSGVTDKFILKSPILESIVPSSAIAGTDVSLNGFYLNGPAIRVFVGGIEAALKFTGKNKVTFVVPDGVESGPVKVSIRTGHEVLTDDIDFIVL